VPKYPPAFFHEIYLIEGIIGNDFIRSNVTV
jgi:hypothetical protein